MSILIFGSNNISNAIASILRDRYTVHKIDQQIINKSLKALRKYVEQIGYIDALINSNAYNILSPLEELDMKDLKSVFDLNLFNSIKMIKSVLPIMRKQNFGKIINIVSVAGSVGFPMVSAYSSSQFALEGLSESLRYEVGAYNIKVVLVEIGAIKGYLDSITNRSNDEYYSRLLNKMDEGLKMLLEHGIDADHVAKLVSKILDEKEPAFRYSIGNDVSLLLEAKRKLSDKEFERFMKEEILPE